MAKNSTIRKLPNQAAIEAFTNGGTPEVAPQTAPEPQPEVKPKPKAKAKPKKQEQPKPPLPDHEPIGKQQRVPLRLYPDVVDDIDLLLRYRRRKSSRNAWILEAIEEKIKREKKEHGL